MSTLIRDTSGVQPPLTRKARPVDPKGRWEWPDPVEVTPPPEATAAMQAAPVPLAARWQCEPLPPVWPPLPAAGRDPGFGAEDRDDPFDDFAAIPSAQYTPGVRSVRGQQTGAQPTAQPRLDAPRSEAPRTQSAMSRAAVEFGQQTSGALAFSLDWASATAIPEEPQRGFDPSPSRLRYRLSRLWLTPTIRHFVRVGLPILLMVGVLAIWLSDADRRAALVSVAASARASIENLPQFQVTAISVQSRSPEVAQGVEQLLGLSFPISSFQLDLAALRDAAEALDAVDRASVQVRSGVLEVVIEERLPAMIWRNGTSLDLIDATGHRVARLASRNARPDLPLIAGAGAPAAIAEAHLLWAAAAPLHGRLRGLVRIGERRWDLVLDRDQRIMLPADGALGALEHVMALNMMPQDLLSRDVRVVDLRNPSRPTLRLSPDAMAELIRNRRASSGAQNR